MLVVSKAVVALSRVGAVVVLARQLPKGDFGLISFVLLTYMAVTTFAQVGLPASVFYYFGTLGPGCYRRLAYLLAKVLLALSLAAGLLLIAVGMIAAGRGYDVLPLVLPLALLVVLELPTYHIQNVLIAVARTREAAWVNIGFSTALFAAISLPPTLHMPMDAIPMALLGYGTLRLLVTAYLFATRLERSRERLPRSMIRSLFRYSVPLGLAELIWKLNRLVDKYVVMSLLPIVAFAEYSVGSWELPLVPAIHSSGSCLGGCLNILQACCTSVLVDVSLEAPLPCRATLESFGAGLFCPGDFRRCPFL